MEAPSNDAINRAEQAWNLDLDDERRAILKSTNTVDIRACPGSGKTTLLVVKLALLAQQWTSKHTGICVLSHTNAARREIEHQLSKHPALSPLLSYPHFVGTIQKFLHEFLGTPAAIEAFGTRPHIVDNDHYTKEAATTFFGKISYGNEYSKARFFLDQLITNNPKYESVGDFIGAIQYRNDELELEPNPGTKKKPINWESQTGQAVTEHKKTLSRQGIFRYQDLAALAARHAAQHPGLAAIISTRFPIVLIDETQDTIEEQANLIKQLFAGRSIIQRFGDDRQAIYHSNNTKQPGAQFPEGIPLSMQRSFRLSPSIARLARHVCADKTPEDLLGNPERDECQHTIFVFTHDTIKTVLPAYCELVAKELGLTTKDEIKAVGANTKAKPEENKFPSAVPDYWENYEAPHKKNKQRITCLAGALAQAHTELESTRSTGDARNTLLRACAQLLRAQGITNDGKPHTPSSLVRHLREEHPSTCESLLKCLATILRKTAKQEMLDPVLLGESLRDHLQPFLNEDWTDDAIRFCTQEVDPVVGASEPPSETATLPNVFRHERSDGPVDVNVGTIHSVKGQTLRSILVLETFNRSHDLQQLFERGPLKGTAAKKLGKQFEEHLRRVFVGMTRPTELLCLAILDEHLNDNDRTALETLGWTITTV